MRSIDIVISLFNISQEGITKGQGGQQSKRGNTSERAGRHTQRTGTGGVVRSGVASTPSSTHP